MHLFSRGLKTAATMSDMPTAFVNGCKNQKVLRFLHRTLCRFYQVFITQSLPFAAAR